MIENININLNGKKITVPNDTQLYELVKAYNYKNIPVIGVKVDHEITNLDQQVKENSLVEFLYVYDVDGNKMYKSGLKFILIAAINEVYDKQVSIHFEHSIDKGLYFTLHGNDNYSDADIFKIRNKIDEIISSDEKFKKVNVSKKDAIEYYRQMNEKEKARNIQNLSNPVVCLYQLRNNYNYFYTDMPYSTECISEYNIIHLDENRFVLQFPVINLDEDTSIPGYTHYPLNLKAFSEYKKWIEDVRVVNVADVNNLVSHNKIEDFIYTNELYLHKNILKEAEKIYNDPNIRVILIAGPSSSGKTTTSKKLGLALKAYGKKIITISADDYYLDQNQMPEEVVKKRDFESIDLLDLDLLNQNLKQLLNLEDVSLPTYDFAAGVKEYGKAKTKIDDNTLIIIEGIHAINNKLIRDIPEKWKYKIYVSPFEPLVIDRHNHLSTIDLRLLRRIVRDNRSRAVKVEDTLKTWHIVRKGEEENIFPYMNDVNSVINTSLIYEIGILKVYVEPLLYSVPVKSAAYEEAKRLIEFLKIFYPIPSEYVDKDSLLREFIGGSIFEK